MMPVLRGEKILATASCICSSRSLRSCEVLPQAHQKFACTRRCMDAVHKTKTQGRGKERTMFFVRKHRISCAAAAMTIAMAGMPMAVHANNTSGVNSSAAVLATCTIVGSAIAFGTYSSTQVDQTGTITVVCTNGISYSIGLDAGAGTGATTAVRKLTGSSGGTLNYTVYRDAAGTSNWGSTIGTDRHSGNANGVVQNFTGYVNMPRRLTPQSGTYVDTVTITLGYDGLLSLL